MRHEQFVEILSMDAAVCERYLDDILHSVGFRCVQLLDAKLSQMATAALCQNGGENAFPTYDSLVLSFEGSSYVISGPGNMQDDDCSVSEYIHTILMYTYST